MSEIVPDFSWNLARAHDRRLRGEFGRAAEYYLMAAHLAPTRLLEYSALLCAWCAAERASGRVSALEEADATDAA